MNPVLLNEKGEELPGTAEGILSLKGSWPSMFRDLYGNHQRYEETYFSPFKVRTTSARCGLRIAVRWCCFGIFDAAVCHEHRN